MKKQVKMLDFIKPLALVLPGVYHIITLSSRVSRLSLLKCLFTSGQSVPNWRTGQTGQISFGFSFKFINYDSKIELNQTRKKPSMIGLTSVWLGIGVWIFSMERGGRFWFQPVGSINPTVPHL